MAGSSPFHPGEQAIQSRTGVRGQTEAIGRRFVRDHLPDEHRAFYEGLPYLVVGSLDDAGRPWASLLAGPPGFARSPDPATLEIAARPTWGDPLQGNLKCGAPIGVLGIDYQTRRRNRISGRICSCGTDRLTVRVHQTFGNCPKFIQAREVIDGSPPAPTPRRTHPLATLGPRARGIIESADHFFIATHYSDGSDDPTYGADVSHRGGKPGFARVDDPTTLTFPDFSGNNHFNTLGNIERNPVAGLLFLDFTGGDVLYLTGTAEILWDGNSLADFTGAERLVRFHVGAGRLVEAALQLRFAFREYSPFLAQTGSWEEVAAKQQAREEGPAYRELEVVRVERESSTVTSFFLEPTDGGRIDCHQAGQFLPVEVALGSGGELVKRAYTISSAPNGQYYRLSIKREAPIDAPPGRVSNHFHLEIAEGSTLRAGIPRGQFTLDTTHTRPVVLLSAGVGVTPMISMLEQLAANRQSCGCQRDVWFLHGARSSAELAFGDYVRGLREGWPELSTHIRFSQPAAGDVQGRDHDSVGRIDAELLASILPIDDADFYLCGPDGFMQTMVEALHSLGVDDSRVRYEYFGAGRKLTSRLPSSPASVPSDAKPIGVTFAKSQIDVVWEPSRGTLLELAESVGIEAPYSCRSGACQTCAVRIESGSVGYVEPPAVPPPRESALICCAYPTRAKDNGTVPLVLDL